MIIVNMSITVWYSALGAYITIIVFSFMYIVHCSYHCHGYCCYQELWHLLESTVAHPLNVLYHTVN